MSQIATLSAKFKISIPRDVHEREGWKPGQQLVLIPHGKGYFSMSVAAGNDFSGLTHSARKPESHDR